MERWKNLSNCFLITEVTALRTQITELKANALSQERVTRERQREEYNDLVHNLFQACYTLKQRLDEYRSVNKHLNSLRFTFTVLPQCVTNLSNGAHIHSGMPPPDRRLGMVWAHHYSAIEGRNTWCIDHSESMLYREEIYEDVCKKVNETAREADQNMAKKLQQKYNASGKGR